jgi:tetratricopeptide (TPR) repeat protein
VTATDLPSIQNVFATAVRHHQAGRLREAEHLYRQVLAADTQHADSLHLLGVLAHQSGRRDVAVDLIGKAISTAPSVAVYHFNLGTVLSEQGRREEAAACYQRALELRPDYPDAHLSLGIVLEHLGRLDEAVASYRQALALRPDDADAYNNQGNALQRLGRLDEAAVCYRRAIALRPDFPEVHNNLGNALLQLRRPEEAIDCYHRAIDLRPDYPEAHNNLGTAMRHQGLMDEAIAYCRRALALRPDYAAAQKNLALILQTRQEVAESRQEPDDPYACNDRGNMLQQLGRLDEAIACYRRALAFRPDFPEVLNNLGNALQQQGHMDEAIVCYDRAIALKPGYAEAHSNLGNAWRGQARLDNAVAACRRAVELRPDYPGAHTNLALGLLGQGDMTAAWPEYEWRWKTPQLINGRRGFPRPQWYGEPGQGRTLLIHAEQGFGDTLQFCRYATLAAARGLRVILEVQTAMVRLLRSLPGVDRVVAFGEALPPFDLQCPMLSLPLAFGTTVETIPRSESYLRADAADVAIWQARLAPIGSAEPKIGLVWAGNPRGDQPMLAHIDWRRSIAPDRLAPLFDLTGLRFVSLQKDGPAAPAHFPLTDLMGEVSDFADTAALVANLDLVITVDTAVAHLAGALGKPVWLLNRFDSCWRWFETRRDSPWYPTLRLYRQPQAGDWDSVIADVFQDLRDFV